MAQSFQFDFKFNWSQPERATAAFLQKIEKDLQALQSRMAKNFPNGAPQTGTKARAQFDQLEKDIGSLSTVTSDRERIEERTRAARLRRANLDVLSQQILEQQKNNEYLRGWVAQRKATDQEYIRATVNRRRLEAQEQLAIQQQFLNANPRSAAGQALNAEARAKVNQSVLQAQNVLREQAAVARLTKEQLGTSVGGKTGFAQLQAAAAVAQQAQALEIKAETERQKASSGRYINAVASSTVAEEQRKAAVQQAVLAQRATNPQLAKLQAENNVRVAVATAERATIEARLLAGSQQDLAIMAQRIVAEKELQIALNQRVAGEVRNAQAAGQLQQGTFFQRVQASIASRQGGNVRLPQEFQTGGQFLTSKALTTAGFAASGALFFGLITGARQAFEEANKLERQLILIREQLVQADQAGDFPKLRSAILEISRDTGVAASDLAFLALQLRGAFDGKPIEFVNRQLQAAARISRVTTLPLSEVTDSLTSIANTFDTTFEDIGDRAVGLQSRFGVLASEIITFTADLAPAAEQAGATLEEVTALGAVLQRASGRSGSQLAEAIGRILPQIQENAGAIVSVLSSAEGQARSTSEIVKALGEGRTFDVLSTLVENFDQLSVAQQQTITAALGGRREASTLNALFGDAKAYRQELERIKNGQTDQGRLEQQFNALGESLNQTFAELKQSATQLGVALIAAGIAPTLKGIADAMQLLLTIMRPLIGFLTAIDLGGAIGQFNLLGTAMTPLLIMAGARGLRNVLGGLGQRFAPANATPGTSAASAAGLGGLLSGVAPTQGGVTVKASNLAAQVQAQAAQAGTAAGTTINNAAVRASKAVLDPILEGARRARTAVAASASRAIAGLATVKGAIALTATIQAIELIQQLNQQIEDDVSSFKQQIRGRLESDPEGLLRDAKEIRDQQESFTTKALTKISSGFGLFGDDRTPGQVAVDEANKRIKQNLERQLKQFQKAGVNLKQIKSLDPQALEFASKFGAEAVNEQLKRAVAEASKQVADPGKLLRRAARAQKRSDFRVAANTGLASVNLAAIQGEFEVGARSLSDFITEVRRQRDGLARVVAEAKNPTKEATDALKAFDQILTQALAQRFQQDIDFALQIRRLQGIQTDNIDVSIIQTALQDKNIRDPAQRLTILNQVFQTLQEIVNERVANAKDAEEALRVGQQGVAVDLGTQVAFVRVQLEQAIQKAKGVIRKQLLLVLAGGDEDKLNQLLNEIAQLQLENGLTYSAALRIEILRTIDDLRQKIAGLRALRELRGRLNKAQREQLAGFKAALQGAKDLLQGVDAAPELDQAAQIVDTIRADNIPELQRNAADEAEQRAKEAREAAKALAEAQLDFWLALVEKDPVRAAQVAIAQADNAAAFAENEADRVRAAADRIRAERSLQEAIFDITNSQIEFVLALVNMAGDTVTAAQVQLDLARQKLGQAQQLGAGEAEINRLRADIVNAEAALRDASLQSKLDTIDFNLEVEKISKQQAIAQLEALLSQADVLHLTEQQRRDLILKIRQLRQDLGRDLQFNLPSELKLPTLYEVRRLNQSGGNYQDNRNISIVLNSNQDIGGAVQTIIDAVNQPPVVGSRPRIY